MLDVNQIAGQIARAGQESARRRRDAAEHVSHAVRVARWEGKNAEIEQKRLLTAQTSWLVAHPLDGLPSHAFPAPAPPSAYNVVASDGSQIAPDRHEGTGGVYLLNVGRVRLTYPAPDAPLVRPRLDSVADVLTLADEDDETERQAASGLAPRRFAREMAALSDLAREASAIGPPTVALTDGSLIAWQLAPKPNRSRDTDDAPAPDPAQEEAFAALLDTLRVTETLGVPLAGYISGPGSRDVTNALRIALCPEVVVNCFRCPFKDQVLPCEPVRLATDAALFAGLLCPGERSSVFTAEAQVSGYSHILRDYPPGHWIAFFYLNTGSEIARIEVPRWVVDNDTLLNLVHAVCLDQSRKGRGYPVALAEAHEQAVIRGADRDVFLGILHRTLVREGQRIAPTRKAAAKQGRGL